MQGLTGTSLNKVSSPYVYMYDGMSVPTRYKTIQWGLNKDIRFKWSDEETHKVRNTAALTRLPRPQARGCEMVALQWMWTT